MKNLVIIACVGKDGGLGLNGKLLWRIPEDLRFFRETTKGNMVIMGRKTFDSIGKALPGRQNVVLSSRKHEGDSKTEVAWCDREELDAILANHSGLKFVIGGASLYEMFLPEAERIILTEVDAIKPADVYFPQFNRSGYVRRVVQNGKYDTAKYEIVEYTKRR